MLLCHRPCGSWPSGTHTMGQWTVACCYIGPSCTTEWNSGHGPAFSSIGALAALFFQDWFKDNRTLETNKYYSTQIKIIHSANHCASQRKFLFWRYGKNPTPTSDTVIPPTHSSRQVVDILLFPEFNLNYLRIMFASIFSEKSPLSP